MHTDLHISNALEKMVNDMAVPPAPLLAIQCKIEQARPAPRLKTGHLILATGITVVALLVALASIAPGFVDQLESTVATILQWQPPPPMPASLMQSLLRDAQLSQNVTMGAAQSRVPFKITAPAGLPHDIRASEVKVVPTAIYSKVTRLWQMGSPTVSFIYRRAHGGSFALRADAFDPRMGLPSRYIFEDKGVGAGGREILMRREQFAWRNGNQVMTVVEGEGINAREIQAIRIAMGGVSLAAAETWSALNSGTLVKLYPEMNP